VIAVDGAPKISVIVTCYNLGTWLDESVGSVLAQTCQDFEVIVVDDGSTDPATQAIVAGYRRPGVRVVRTGHAGVAAARNAGLSLARGEYLCILDADDRLHPSFFEKAVRVLDADTSVTFVGAWLRAFGDEEWEWKPERCDLQTLLCEDTVLTAALVRKEAVVGAGGFDTAMPVQGDDDWDLWLTLLERGARGVILREVLYDYRRRAGSVSTVCWHGAGHLPLARYRLAKHEATYRAHLEDVLERQDGETAALLRRNDELERRIAAELEPMVALRRNELASLQSRLDAPHAPAADARARELEAALHAATAEVAALRQSASWRITAPLRGAYGWWLRQRGAP